MTKQPVNFLAAFLLLIALITSVAVGSVTKADAPGTVDQQQGVSTETSNSSDAAYQAYINDLKLRTLPENYDELRTIALNQPQTLAATNPEGDYGYQLGVRFTYTYRGSFSLTAGKQVVFETRKSDPYASDPEMFLYKADNPMQYSWSDDNGGSGYQSKIVVTPSVSGTYTLVVQAAISDYPGTSDLYKDGKLFKANIPVAGQSIWCVLPNKTGNLNFFTCQLSSGSNTVMWLIDLNDPNSGRIRAYNDNYAGSGSWTWGRASRIKANFNFIVAWVTISSTSVSTAGTCDVYWKLDNSTAYTSFPKLKADDAIKTAPASNAYNCISWSGGITNTWVWPPSQGSPWYNSNSLIAFDNFYGNKPARYTGAWTYTRSGATQTNSVIDLWYNPNYYGTGQGDFTHGSVKKPGNDMPHGYDWESKPGGLMRTLHPRFALRSSVAYGYGDVKYYYISTGKVASSSFPLGIDIQRGLTFDEAEQAGLIVRELVGFTAIEETKLANLIEKVPQNVKQDFDEKYQAWKATWGALSYQSNPRVYAQSKEYKAFLDFCNLQGQAVWPIIFQYQAQGDFLITNAIDDLTLSEYGYLLTAIREDSSREKYNDNGVYIVPSLEGNYMKYSKAILNELQ